MTSLLIDAWLLYGLQPMRWLAPAIAVVCLLGVPRANAQGCGGDCNGDGAVSIGDLILSVNISLDRADLSSCLAIDGDQNGVVAINELVLAVRHGLSGCPATPTPSLTPIPTATATPTSTSEPTATPTVTSTPTATATITNTSTATLTPTATPTVIFPDVSGAWSEGQLALVSSTCLEIFATEFAAELARRPPCPHQVSSFGPIATVVDCNQQAFVGALDASGVITFERPDELGEDGGCTIRLTTAVRVPASSSPTAASYFFELQFGGTCPLDSCELTASAPWTRTGP